jgi:hypothetical protein
MDGWMDGWMDFKFIYFIHKIRLLYIFVKDFLYIVFNNCWKVLCCSQNFFVLHSISLYSGFGSWLLLGFIFSNCTTLGKLRHSTAVAWPSRLYTLTINADTMTISASESSPAVNRILKQVLVNVKTIDHNKRARITLKVRILLWDKLNSEGNLVKTFKYRQPYLVQRLRLTYLYKRLRLIVEGILG